MFRIFLLVVLGISIGAPTLNAQRRLPQINPITGGYGNPYYQGIHYGKVRMVRNWYAQYLKREVDPEGLRTWVRVIDTQGIRAALSGILGSAEYYTLHQEDPGTWISAMYVDILGRRASLREIRSWLRVWEDLSGDRQRVAFEFLTAASRELGQ
jgi:hypothetical protein